jgi:hypothetical protein
MLCRIKQVSHPVPNVKQQVQMVWSFDKLELHLHHTKSTFDILPCSFLPRGEMLLALTNWGFDFPEQIANNTGLFQPPTHITNQTFHLQSQRSCTSSTIHPSICQLLQKG